MLGTDFPYQQFFPSKAKIIQVDIRGENLGRRTPVDLGLVGSVRDTVEALLPLLKERPDTKHLDSSTAHYARARKSLDDLAVNDRNRTPIHPQYVARLVSELASDDAVFIPDVGSPVVWAARYLQHERPPAADRLVHARHAWRTRCRRRSARSPRSPAGRSSRSPGTADSRC